MVEISWVFAQVRCPAERWRTVAWGRVHDAERLRWIAAYAYRDKRCSEDGSPIKVRAISEHDLRRQGGIDAVSRALWDGRQSLRADDPAEELHPWRLREGGGIPGQSERDGRRHP